MELVSYLRKKGLSFRQISVETGIPLATVSRRYRNDKQ
jgi:uncharacterized protein YerC